MWKAWAFRSRPLRRHVLAARRVPWLSSPKVTLCASEKSSDNEWLERASLTGFRAFRGRHAATRANAGR